MPFNSTHVIALENALAKMKPGDFFLVNNGYDRNNETYWNAQENAAIRAVSGVPFGHVALYIGEGKAMEMPVKLNKVKDIFAGDRTNAVACIRCNELTAKQRGRISQFVSAYYKYNRTNEKSSYGFSALAVGSVGEVGTHVIRKLAAHAIEDEEFGDMVGSAFRPLLQTPATAVTIISAEINELFGNMPALSCAGFITYAHAVAGHIIDDGWVSYPTHSTPASLWDIVRADKAKYSLDVLNFFDDHVTPEPKATKEDEDSTSDGSGGGAAIRSMGANHF